jgi:DnaJ family protein C protein 3
MKTTDIVNDHLDKGKKLLAAGQLSDALSHFHSAIGMMKFEYIYIFNRSVFLRCGSTKLS